MSPNHTMLSNDQLLQVLATSNNAVAIHVTDQFNIQYATDPMLAIWGKGKGVLGLPLIEALPELKGQPFVDMFKKVWDEGIVISGTDTPADLLVDGKIQTYYFDFEYRAIKNAEGKTYCILHSATDVTERVQSKLREQDMAEELTAINEELYAANEELSASNEELNESRQSLQHTYEGLIESDARFRNMIRQAPVGICVISANNLMIQEVNNAYLELIGKKREEMEGLTIWQAVAEAAEAYAPVMNKVIETGEPFYAIEHEVMLIRNHVPENVILDFVYEPVRNIEGMVNAVMVLVTDVTDKVKARRSIEEVEERIRLAVEAAEMGTYDVDMATGKLTTSERFNAIFGFDTGVTRDKFVAAIHPDDQQIRTRAHKEAYKSGKLFYEARVVHPDLSVHWVRVQGETYMVDGKPVRMLGTVLDITHFKRLERQKDDFISIASHELKTPITSLQASLQLLERMKDNPSPVMLPKLIDQAGKSMQKIRALVNDLLNVGRANDTHLKLNKAKFNVSELLDSCCSHIRSAGKYQLKVRGDEQIQVIGDEHAIDQVIVNLVNNAVKYAPDSLEIALIVEKVGDNVKIAVQDHGPGIPADKLPHLFERYYQADATGYQNSGLGLGLYISSESIKRHNGTIGVDSELGKGSTFWFTLPLNETE